MDLRAGGTGGAAEGRRDEPRIGMTSLAFPATTVGMQASVDALLKHVAQPKLI